MIYNYKNIPWDAFIRQEDIDMQMLKDELKKQAKLIKSTNPNPNNQSNKKKLSDVNNIKKLNIEIKTIEIDFDLDMN